MTVHCVIHWSARHRSPLRKMRTIDVGCKASVWVRQGPPRRVIFLPMDGREVVPRISSSQADVIVRGSDSEAVLDVVQAGPRATDARRSRRRARSESESEGPLVFRNRFSVMSSDSDDDAPTRPGIQSPEGGTTIPASSGAVVALRRCEEPSLRQASDIAPTQQDSVGVSDVSRHATPSLPLAALATNRFISLATESDDEQTPADLRCSDTEHINRRRRWRFRWGPEAAQLPPP